MKEDIRLAKERMLIPELWGRLGLQGYVTAGKKISSPFRRDRNPSFSIFPDGRGFRDFATGESGDAIVLVEKALGLNRKDALKVFLKIAGSTHVKTPPVPSAHLHRGERPRPSCDLRPGNTNDFKKLSSLRNLSREGLELAQQRGFLHFAEIKGQASWVVTDATRQNIQARRLDGLPWHHLPGFPKAYTLPGSRAAWPLGGDEVGRYEKIVVVEGGPDALGAHCCIAIEEKPEVGVLAIMGSSNSIPSEVLASLKGKPVRIYGHNDYSGQKAVQKWIKQLQSVSCQVSEFVFSKAKQLNGQPVNDLCDLLNLGPDDFEKYRAFWEVLP